ncbi:MAG: class I SAM-dependent methyltransferase [Acidobacteriia bacterium]|nr:class I SAM-dependent methyltransferase [Terriglobia bacterium]
MESISCIFCGIDDSFPVIQENGYTGRKCRQCGLIYVSPRPSREDIRNLYEHDGAVTSSHCQFASEHYKRLHARLTLNILRGYASGGKLLEIGPGAGLFMDEARAEGFTPYGVELNLIQADYIRNRWRLPCESRPSSDAYPGESFDVIYHCDVISHLCDPSAEFRIMRERLTPHGVLIFETGNMGDVRPDRLAMVPQFQYPDHLFFFSTRNIESLLQLSGFHPVRQFRFSTVPELLLRQVLSRLKAPSNGPVIAATGAKVAGSSSSALKARLRMFARYRLGACLPIYNHHQTMIVIATPAQ